VGDSPGRMTRLAARRVLARWVAAVAAVGDRPDAPAPAGRLGQARSLAAAEPVPGARRASRAAARAGSGPNARPTRSVSCSATAAPVLACPSRLRTLEAATWLASRTRVRRRASGKRSARLGAAWRVSSATRCRRSAFRCHRRVNPARCRAWWGGAGEPASMRPSAATSKAAPSATAPTSPACITIYRAATVRRRLIAWTSPRPAAALRAARAWGPACVPARTSRARISPESRACPAAVRIAESESAPRPPGRRRETACRTQAESERWVGHGCLASSMA
jgi:hypothetical protein